MGCFVVFEHDLLSWLIAVMFVFVDWSPIVEPVLVAVKSVEAALAVSIVMFMVVACVVVVVVVVPLVVVLSVVVSVTSKEVLRTAFG